jgi:putative addiction module killer protein
LICWREVCREARSDFDFGSAVPHPSILKGGDFLRHQCEASSTKNAALEKTFKDWASKIQIQRPGRPSHALSCKATVGRTSIWTMVSYVLPLTMVEVREYLDRRGLSPFAAWSDRLNAEAAAKIVTALARIQQGNFSSAKGVSAGVYEYRIHFGPGYRIYFGKDGDRLVILVGGGTKNRQQQDIKTALTRWQDYKERK